MEKEIKKLIGKRLKETRKKLNLSEEDPGKIINKESLTIRSYETGARSPSLEYLYYLAENNQDLNYIFTGIESCPKIITQEEYDGDWFKQMEKQGYKVEIDSKGNAKFIKIT